MHINTYKRDLEKLMPRKRQLFEICDEIYTWLIYYIGSIYIKKHFHFLINNFIPNGFLTLIILNELRTSI